ncbi:hypothetical protein CF319_g4536 [Tilletia indica]|nr:hypothetical protein CF319_g4536 [Tilletia indica]
MSSREQQQSASAEQSLSISAVPAQSALPDPFSPSPSRSASSAPSTRSSRSDDSISPSASASQVRANQVLADHALGGASAAFAEDLATAQTQPFLSQDSTSPADHQGGEPVEPPPAVDALQPSPLHMLTLLGSQLLQHDQHRQQDEQARELGLSGIEELFNEEEAARLEIEEEEASFFLDDHLPSFDAMEQSRSSLPQTPHLSDSLTENLRLEGAAASVPLRTLPLALVQESIANLAVAGDIDEQTPRGPLTPLQASQLISPGTNRSREGPSSLSPRMESIARVGGSSETPSSEAFEQKTLSPDSNRTKRSLAFATPEEPTKALAPSARQLLASHLVKLFGLPPSITSADGSTRPVRVLSLHPAHLFRSGTLLTGTLYLTSTHMLFYAYMRPRAPGAVLQMGMLGVARGKGWGWADDAWAKSHGRSAALAAASPAVAQESGSDSVATLQGHSRGSFGAAARIGALLRMPSAALGVGSSNTSAAAQGSATTPSPSDSAFLFGTTPTTKAPFGGFEPVSTSSAASAVAPPLRQTQSTATAMTMSFGRRAPRKRAHHFVLTPRSLSWFASERDPYFPVGQLDLRWVRAVYEPVSGSDTTPGGSEKAEAKAAAEWFVEYVIPPGPRKQQTTRAGGKGAAAKKDTDEQERRYTLLLRAPSAEEAHSWCEAVRRAVLRAGGANSIQGGKPSTNAGASLDVRRDSVRVSIPLGRIVDVEGSVGASGVSGADIVEGGASGGRSRGRKGKGRATEGPAGEDDVEGQSGPSPEDDEADGRTFVIRVWDNDSKSTSTNTSSQTDDADDVVPLDEYCFVDVQRQQDLWRRLERALARVPPATDSQAAGQQDANVTGEGDEDDLARTYTEKPVPFTYPPSITRPISPRMSLPRALSGPAKRLATGLSFTRPVAVGLGVGASNVKNFVGYSAMGLVERVKEVWTVAPAGVAGRDNAGVGIGSSPSLSQPASRSRSRSRSGSEGWIADEMKVEDGEEGEEGVEVLEEEGDAEADLADSMSFSIVDLSSSTGNLDGADESDIDNISSGGNGSKTRTKAEQYNLDLFYRTFVLPLSPSSLSLSDPDILGGHAEGVLSETFSSPGSRSGTSSSLDRSATAERLLHTFTTASLYRVLPIAGRLFVSERFLCFRSARGLVSRVNAGLGGLAQGAAGLAAAVSNLASQPGVGTAAAAAGAAARPLLAATGFAGGSASSLPTAGSGAGGAATGGGRTLMMLPLADVIGVANNRAYRYGHSGMVVMVRGHEEIFFEFSSANEQRLCISTIEHQMEVLHRNSADRTNRVPPIAVPTTERSDAFILRDLGERLDWSMHSSIHSNFPGSSVFPTCASDDYLDAPAQAARRLRSELGMTSPVTSPSSPKFSRAVLSPNRSGVGEHAGQRKRSRSISTMSAPGLRSVGEGGRELSSAVATVPAGDVSTTDTDTGTTTSSDLLSVSSKPKSSLHFTMLTIGSRGDVQPYIALSKRLLAEGHRVRIATHGEFREWIEGHGIEFYEVGGDPAELMRICVENGTFTLSFLREGVTKFRGWLDDLLVSSWAACQGTDIVIESPSAMAGIHIAEALQVPYFRAFTMPWTRTRTYPHAFAVPSGKAGGNYNYMTYVIFDQVFWRASAGQVNRWRRKTLGLRSTSLEEMSQHKVPFLYNFSPSLVPKPLDWYDWIHVTGFWFLDGPENSKTRTWEPPAELVTFIMRAREAKRKVVYIGWGSIVLSNAEETHQIVVEAVRKSGVCAILSKGWSDRLSNKTQQQSEDQQQREGEEEEDMSDRILELNSVPHDWLFPQLDAACHHGGAGTLGASLRAGIPTIVKPHFADQFFWGQQVETLGVGRCIRGSLSRDKLAEALQVATRDDRMVRRARELGERIVREDGVGEAIKAIYRDLDYASSLIKRDTGLDGRSGGKPFVPSVATPAPTRHPASLVPPARTTSTRPTATGEEFAGTSAILASVGLGGRKSRETVREAPFAVASGPSSATEAKKRGDENLDDDAASETMSEAWSVVSGSEDDR